MSETCRCPRRLADNSVIMDLARHTDCPIHGVNGVGEPYVPSPEANEIRWAWGLPDHPNTPDPE